MAKEPEMVVQTPELYDRSSAEQILTENDT